MLRASDLGLPVAGESGLVEASPVAAEKSQELGFKAKIALIRNYLTGYTALFLICQLKGINTPCLLPYFLLQFQVYLNFKGCLAGIYGSGTRIYGVFAVYFTLGVKSDMKPLTDLLLEAAKDSNAEILLDIEAKFGVTVGWRCEPDYLLDEIRNQLIEQYNCSEFFFSIKSTHIDISFRGQQTKVRIKRNHRLCFDLIRAANKLFVGNYELRSMKYRCEEAFRTFVLATPEQWGALDRVDPNFEHFEPVSEKSGFLLDKYSWPVARIFVWLGQMIAKLFVAVVVRRIFRSQ